MLVVSSLQFVRREECFADLSDTNSRYERNNGRIDPHYMCGKENKQVAECSSTNQLSSRMTRHEPEIGWNTKNTGAQV